MTRDDTVIENQFRDVLDIRGIHVGIIGHGYVGQAIDEFFKDKCHVHIYDKNKENERYTTLQNLISSSQVIFVCVPTPMKKTGECYTGIIESVLSDIENESQKLKKSLNEFIVVIKSTVYPGFTNKMKHRIPGLRLVFSPEFLTEKNSTEDFKNQNRIIFGGDLNDSVFLFKLFEASMADKFLRQEIDIVQCDPTVAEMVKLFTNAFLMTKVLFGNEIYKLAQKLDAPYDDIVALATLDKRINESHFKVPGHDGHFGAGGHCFPKDINNLAYMCKVYETNEKLFSTVIERNNEIRDYKDWEDMKNRAVTDEE